MARIAAFGTPRASNIQEGAGQCSGAQILAGWGTIYMRQFFYNAILLFAAPSLLLGQVSSYMSTAAPSTNGADNDPVLTITRRVSEVNVLFIATDKHGKFVRNLTLSDFSYLDDHKPSQAILNFRRETDLPLQLGLLVRQLGFELLPLRKEQRDQLQILNRFRPVLLVPHDQFGHHLVDLLGDQTIVRGTRLALVAEGDRTKLVEPIRGGGQRFDIPLVARGRRNDAELPG